MGTVWREENVACKAGIGYQFSDNDTLPHFAWEGEKEGEVEKARLELPRGVVDGEALFYRICHVPLQGRIFSFI